MVTDPDHGDEIEEGNLSEESYVDDTRKVIMTIPAQKKASSIVQDAGDEENGSESGSDESRDDRRDGDINDNGLNSMILNFAQELNNSHHHKQPPADESPVQ